MDVQSEGRIPDPPSKLDLNEVFRVRDKLSAELARMGLVGSVIEGDAVTTLTQVAASIIRCPPEAARLSFPDFEGEFLDVAGRRRLSARLAGNLSALRSGRAVGPWESQRDYEWVIVQVTGVVWTLRSATRWRPESRGYRVHYSILTGSPCPYDGVRFMTPGEMSFCARQVGFDRRGGKLGFREGGDLFGKRFLALLAPEYSREAPGFRDVAPLPSLNSYNRSLLRMQRRIGFRCPEDYTHRCTRCEKGLESCPAAAHRKDYGVIACPACGREWWYDPDPLTGGSSGLCVACNSRREAGQALLQCEPGAGDTVLEPGSSEHPEGEDVEDLGDVGPALPEHGPTVRPESGLDPHLDRPAEPERNDS